MSTSRFKRSSYEQQRGFTLIELLVTIVILGFVVSVMSSAFGQVGQILRVATDSGNNFQQRWLQTTAMNDVVSNLVLDANENAWLIGTPEQFQGLTLGSPLAPHGTPQRVELLFKSRTNDVGVVVTDLFVTQLILPLNPTQQKAPGAFASPTTTGAETTSQPVRWAQWPGKLALSYIDRAGREHANWPPADVVRKELPSEILVRPVGEDKVLVRSAVFEGPLYRPEDKAALRDFLGMTR
ncbi:prepilin-type N-terminal cleavage/methylation domain-containing protein [Variovorax sp. H27-G14]|uniref:type II secretion system protein n=1 Tax=Variovorax sp. H27-G14 TaxID=3111914 RepID=UPI0038FBF0EF